MYILSHVAELKIMDSPGTMKTSKIKRQIAFNEQIMQSVSLILKWFRLRKKFVEVTPAKIRKPQTSKYYLHWMRLNCWMKLGILSLKYIEAYFGNGPYSSDIENEQSLSDSSFPFTTTMEWEDAEPNMESDLHT
ncbi:hypothetical protein AVEN_82055-1 [Araneus ventricosus]|uniref:Uncharacterized protein n=1 Tax=Araneus ventricosus TaxID=182803 RepID=A0A4Y2T327_ARAVE|nr:hypothetical protein AVEN_82055-1 [Araneus ventricosus]